MISNPQTLEEWDAYFARYNADQLMSKAKSMNTMRFVKMMRNEGMEMAEIEQIMTLIARRLMSAGEQPPEGELDLEYLVMDDPLAEIGALPIPVEPFDDRQELTNMDLLQ